MKDNLRRSQKKQKILREEARLKSIYREKSVLMSLEEYLSSFPMEGINLFTEGRDCTHCHIRYHFKNLIFLMATKRTGYGTITMNLCYKCIPYWKDIFIKEKYLSLPNDWNWSTWDLNKSVPHHEADRIFLILRNQRFYLMADFNPSKRGRQIAIEEFPT